VVIHACYVNTRPYRDNRFSCHLICVPRFTSTSFRTQATDFFFYMGQWDRTNNLTMSSNWIRDSHASRPILILWLWRILQYWTANHPVSFILHRQLFLTVYKINWLNKKNIFLHVTPEIYIPLSTFKEYFCRSNLFLQKRFNVTLLILLIKTIISKNYKYLARQRSNVRPLD